MPGAALFKDSCFSAFSLGGLVFFNIPVHEINHRIFKNRRGLHQPYKFTHVGKVPSGTILLIALVALFSRHKHTPGAKEQLIRIDIERIGECISDMGLGDSLTQIDADWELLEIPSISLILPWVNPNFKRTERHCLPMAGRQSLTLISLSIIDDLYKAYRNDSNTWLVY